MPVKTATMRVAASELTAAAAFLLERVGVTPDIAGEAAAAMVEADLCGHGSHGCRLLPAQIDRLRRGEVSGTARPAIVEDRGAILRIDGRRAFGAVAGGLAAREGAARARRHGICAVALTGAGHLGRNGLWAEIAAKAGVVSLHFVNAPGAPDSIVPPGTSVPRLTSNPVAFGAPRPGGDPIILDFSVGAMAVNAIRRAAERSERLPEPCVLTAAGEATDDPHVFLGPFRAMLPFGGHKGFGLALFTEILAGALTGAGVHDGQATLRVNNLLSIHLDIAAFGDRASYDAAVGRLEAWLRATPAVTLPGDRSGAARARNTAAGIPVDAALARALIMAATAAGAVTEFSRRWPTIAALAG